jgi:hypothetical protein
MARTAWTYASRLACYDPDAGQIAELPLEDAGGLGPAAGAAASARLVGG